MARFVVIRGIGMNCEGGKGPAGALAGTARGGILAVALVALGWLALPCLGQELRWRWSNPGPHGNHVTALLQTNGLTVQVCDFGQIYTSEDLESWMPRSSPTRRALRSIAYASGQYGVGCENGAILTGSDLDRLAVQELGTSDWIEGMAVGPPGWVGVGDNAAIYFSATGEEWRRVAAPRTTSLRSVTYGNSRYIAAGESGTLLSSVTGTSWQTLNSGVNAHLNTVVWTGGAFYAAGEGGVIVRSTAGTTWQRVSASNQSNLFCMAAGNQVLAAGEGALMLLQGQTFQDQVDPSQRELRVPPWTYLSSLWDGRLFLVGGRSGRLLEGFITNAATQFVWVERNQSVRNWLWDAARADSYYLAVGDRSTVMSSVDGVRWELELVPDSLVDRVFLGAATHGDSSLVVGNAGAILTSTNGIQWESPVAAVAVDLQGAAWFNGLWIASGAGGTLLTSPDLRTWTTRSTPTTSFLSTIAAVGQVALAAGSNGALLRSTNGVDWVSVPAPTTRWIYRLRPAGAGWVAVGEGGLLMTSVDGVAWQLRSSGATAWLNDVIDVGGRLFAAGGQGTLLSSTNLIDWQPEPVITAKSLYALATHESQLIAVGVEGAILRANVGAAAGPVSIATYEYRNGVNAFLFAGKPDQRFALERGSSLTTWSTAAELEFFDGELALIHLFDSGVTNGAEFFRTRTLP